MSEPHPGVDAYLATLPAWQARLGQDLRELIHAAVPGITETVKRTVRPYFVHHGNVCALLATKDHINLFLYDGAIVPDPDHIITGGQSNSTARTVAFWERDEIPRRAMTTMLTRIAANNEDGGWRRLKGGREPPRGVGDQRDLLPAARPLVAEATHGLGIAAGQQRGCRGRPRPPASRGRRRTTRSARPPRRPAGGGAPGARGR